MRFSRVYAVQSLRSTPGNLSFRRVFFGELFDFLGVQVVRGKLSQEIAPIPGRAVCG